MAWIVVSSAAIVLLLALLARQLEGRRLAAKRRFQSPTAAPAGTQVTVIVPLAGPEHSLRDNLGSWLLQDWPDREIVFVAESVFDPAVPVAEALIREHRYIPARLVCAGTTATRGQRIHQLLRGIEEASAETAILVFGSADAKAKGDAVRWMVHHLADGKNGAVTGNLWTVPRLQTPANRLAAALGNLVAGLAGPGKWNFPCPAGWGIRREQFDRLGLRSVWSTSLAESWCSRAAILRAGYAIRFEPHCIVETTIETTAQRLLDSGIRKCVTARTSAPATWLLALLACLAILAGLIAPVVLAVVALAAGKVWAGFPWLGLAALVYGLGAGATLVRHNTARRLLPAWKHYRSARRFDVQAWPLTALVAATVLLVAGFTSHIRWRGKRFRVGSGGEVRFAGSVPWENILRPGHAPREPEQPATVPLPSPSAHQHQTQNGSRAA